MHAITEIPETVKTNNTVLRDKKDELLNNKPKTMKITEIKSNTNRQVFNFLKLTLRPASRATMDSGDK